MQRAVAVAFTHGDLQMPMQAPETISIQACKKGWRHNTDTVSVWSTGVLHGVFDLSCMRALRHRAHRIAGRMRFASSAGHTGVLPGLVDCPPMSMIVAPCCTRCRPRAPAASLYSAGHHLSTCWVPTRQQVKADDARSQLKKVAGCARRL